MTTEISGDGHVVTGLGGPSGYGEIVFPKNDDSIMMQDVSAVFENGFFIGDRHYEASAFRANNNGFVTFGDTNYSYFNSSLITQGDDPVIAAFWSDIDTRRLSPGEMNQVFVDIDAEADVVTITWVEVLPYSYSNGEEGNTFQIQLFDRGNGAFDFALRYESVDWVVPQGGNDSAGSVGGYNFGVVNGARLFEKALDPNTIGNAEDTVGNTGVQGLWVWSFENSSVRLGTPDSDTLEGTSDADRIFALAGNDVVTGLEGGDIIDGGAGDDHLDGGIGDDRLLGGDGIDTLVGADGADVLDGGAGADQMAGGVGSDRYFVDNVDDTVLELIEDEGTDTVIATVSYHLADGVDMLQLQGTARGGFGNSSDNLLISGAGRQYLDGGAGDDTMEGGNGRDRYLVREAGDVVIESNSNRENLNDRDLVKSLVTYRIPNNVEQLLLRGSANIDAVGSAQDDVLMGNRGDNKLIGREGTDLLRGGAGADAFVFDRAISPQNIDMIDDFKSGKDQIWLKTYLVFVGLEAGNLADTAFGLGAEATTEDQRIVYDAATGYLYHDADGVGGLAAQHFATLRLGEHTMVVASDFVLV